MKTDKLVMIIPTTTSAEDQPRFRLEAADGTVSEVLAHTPGAIALRRRWIAAGKPTMTSLEARLADAEHKTATRAHDGR